MGYRELEDSLRKKLRIRRIILGVFALIFLVLCIVFSYLYEASREVIVHDYGVFTRDEVVYDNSYMPLMVVGIMGTLAMLVLLISDFLSSRFETIDVNGYHVTVYRGMIGNYVYVDGKEREQLEPYSHYIEKTLPDGTVVTFSFGRTMFDWCHVTFSDGRESIDF